jgi:hypothetical protein
LATNSISVKTFEFDTVVQIDVLMTKTIAMFSDRMLEKLFEGGVLNVLPYAIKLKIRDTVFHDAAQLKLSPQSMYFMDNIQKTMVFTDVIMTKTTFPDLCRNFVQEKENYPFFFCASEYEVYMLAKAFLQTIGEGTFNLSQYQEAINMSGQLFWLGEKRWSFNTVIGLLYGSSYLQDYLVNMTHDEEPYVDTKSSIWYIPRFITKKNLLFFCRWIVNVTEEIQGYDFPYSFSRYIENVARAYLHSIRECMITYSDFVQAVKDTGAIFITGHMMPYHINLNSIICQLHGDDYWTLVEEGTHLDEWEYAEENYHHLDEYSMFMGCHDYNCEWY